MIWQPEEKKDLKKLPKEEAEKAKKLYASQKLPANLQKYLKTYDDNVMREVITTYHSNVRHHILVREYNFIRLKNLE